MTVKIGINGFGRIGRLAFRRIFELQARGGQAGDIEVAAINDLTTPSMLAYLLKYDSTHGTFRHDDGTPVDVKATEDSIIVDGKEYKVYAEKDANNIPWVKNDGVEFVLECTGFYTSAEKSQAHINAGAKKVLISAPAKDDTTPTVVFGVNHDILKASDVIVSAGSCTTNSMAAMVKLLDENFGIKLGFITTIHAYTGTQMLLDGPRGTKTGRNLRAAAINTIAHSTGAAKAIGKVVPSVNGKLQGHAQRVQVPDGSVTELTTVLNTETTADEINAAYEWLLQMNDTMSPVYVTDEVIDGMMNGYKDIAVVYSGDAAVVLDENEDMSFYMPSQGTNIWCDAMVIPQNAENPKLAHEFINYMLTYEAAFDNTETVGYTSPNAEVFEEMTSSEDLYADNAAYLPRSGYDKDEMFHDNQTLMRELSKLWIKVKAAK